MGPREAEVMPLQRDETTPPVTKTYLAMVRSPRSSGLTDGSRTPAPTHRCSPPQLAAARGSRTTTRVSSTEPLDPVRTSLGGVAHPSVIPISLAKLSMG